MIARRLLAKGVDVIYGAGGFTGFLVKLALVLGLCGTGYAMRGKLSGALAEYFPSGGGGGTAEVTPAKEGGKDLKYKKVYHIPLAGNKPRAMILR